MEDEELEVIECKNPKIQELFSAWCDAELALGVALDKLPRAGKKCNCKGEKDPPVIKITIQYTENQTDKLRCMDCGGIVD
jgi:hypothetical protein